VSRPNSIHINCATLLILKMSTAERALIDISQDRRYWIIHSITIPSLFVGGVIFMLSGFVYKLFGALNFNKYFDKDNSSISLIKDRFSICSSMDDILMLLSCLYLLCCVIFMVLLRNRTHIHLKLGHNKSKY
jgi:photosystem II cytochrome b559 subunit alpha